MLFCFCFIGNYEKFYSAIKAAYPEVNIISSCHRLTISPSNPADLYDVHVMSLCYFFWLLEQIFLVAMMVPFADFLVLWGNPVCAACGASAFRG